MKKVPEIRIGTQCRACMCRKIKCQLFHPLSMTMTQSGMTLYQMFTHMMPLLVIQMDDEFPQFVCAGCANRLNNAYLFQELCMESDKKYREARYIQGNGTVTDTTIVERTPPLIAEGLTETRSLTFQLPKSTSIVPISKPVVIASKVYNTQEDMSSELDREDIEINVPKPKKKFTCELCQKEYSSNTGLLLHKNTHTNENIYDCQKCGKKFNNKGNLHQHMQRHSNNLRYKCPHCPKKFPCRSDIYKHLLCHSIKKNHICEICGSSFKRSYSLTAHLRRQHSNHDQRTYKCEVCKLSMTSSNKLKLHMRTHTNERPYSCTYCSRAFKQSGDLLKHTRLHLGDKIYDCTICKKKFKYKAELQEHQTVCPPKNVEDNENLPDIDIKEEFHDSTEYVDNGELFNIEENLEREEDLVKEETLYDVFEAIVDEDSLDILANIGNE